MSNVAVDENGKSYYADRYESWRVHPKQLYCPNSQCNCKLRLKNLYGSTAPYFSASPSHPHRVNCEYANSAPSAATVNASGFSPDKLLADLLRTSETYSASNKKQPKQSNHGTESGITSARQLYLFCRDNDDETIVSGSHIWQFYKHKRNQDKHDNSRNQIRLDVLGFSNCNWKNRDKVTGELLIWCWFPHDEEVERIRLGFEDNEAGRGLMRDFCRKLNPIKDSCGHAYIAVFGKWDGKHCSIQSKRQIYLITQRPS